MRLTFHTERWPEVLHELQEHWPAHWNEVATHKDKIPLDPDYVGYQRQHEGGHLHVTTARASGKLAGYVVAIVRPHLHYAHSLSAFYDLYYLAPAYRKGWNGVRLFREAERALKARGVERMFTGTKLSKDASRIFERLGWLETERLYVKWIGE
jgi:GNAT superfamily N-acetyltransferase